MITIIIVIYKSDPQKISRLLNIIKNKYKIIIIDNSENYDFSKINISKKTQILRSKNIGNGAAINKAIKKCKTKYAIYTDLDVQTKKNFFENFLKKAKKISDFSVLVPNHGKFYKNKPIMEYYFGEASVMFYNIKKLKKLKFFDENYFLYYEELDLLHRCKVKNYKCYMIPSLKIKHFRATSIYNENNNIKCLRAWHYMWSMFYFYKKNFGFFSAVKKTYLFLIKDLIMLIKLLTELNFKDMKIRFYRLFGLLSSLIGLNSFLRP